MSTEQEKLPEEATLADTLRQIIDGQMSLLFLPVETEPGKPLVVGVTNMMLARVTPDRKHTIRFNNPVSRELLATDRGLAIALAALLEGFLHYEAQAHRVLEEQAEAAKQAEGNGHRRIILPGEG